MVARAGAWENPAHETMLRDLWGRGASAAQIAKQLSLDFTDVGYSRNAVIGKVHRLGLVNEGRARPSAPKTRIVRPSPPTRLRAQANIFGETKVAPVGGGLSTIRVGANRTYALPPSAPLPETISAFAPVAGSKPKPWMQRRFGECNWIVGGTGADALSCCAPIAARGWCSTHLMRGIAKPVTEAQRQAAAKARDAKRRAA